MAYVPDEAIDSFSELSKGARLLYVFLCRVRNQETGRCFPSVSTTMASLGVNKPTVYALRKELASKGWATFDGDWIVQLRGFSPSLKNQTFKTATKALSSDSLKNQTKPESESEKSDSTSKKPYIESEKSEFQSEKSDSHIRNNQQIEPCNNNVVVLRARVSAESEQREYLKIANGNGHTNGNGKTQNLGTYAFGDYLDYVTARNPGKDAAQAAGLARWMQKQGEDDEAVAAWLKSKSSPVESKPKKCRKCNNRGDYFDKALRTSVVCDCRAGQHIREMEANVAH